MLNILNFISYWYMRYLLVTELYLVEKWERQTIHVILLILFVGFGYMNKLVITFFTNYIVGNG